MFGRTRVKIGLGVVVIALVALLMDQDLMLREAREVADAAAEAPAEEPVAAPSSADAPPAVAIDGVWRADSVRIDGEGRSARGSFAARGGRWSLLLIPLDDGGEPVGARVESGVGRVVGDTLVVRTNLAADFGTGGGDPAVTASREGVERRVALRARGDRLEAAFPDGRVLVLRRTADGPDGETGRLPGAWEARRTELAGGADYPMAGHLVFGAEGWVAAWAMVDSAGAVHRVTGEHGRWSPAEGGVELTVADRVTWGEERPGLTATPTRLETSVGETATVATAGSGGLLVLRFPGWGRMRFLRLPGGGG